MEIAKGYKVTDFGLLPEDWDIVTINDVAVDMADGPFGSNLKKEHYTERSEVRIIQLSNIGEDGWKDENIKYTTFKHMAKLPRCIVAPGNAVVAKMMPAGRAIICPNKDPMYALSSDAVKIVFNENRMLTKYFIYATKTNFFQKQINDEIQGSTRARTSISKLKKNCIVLPRIIEQTAIVEVLFNADRLIDSLEKLIAKKKVIKQGAMQELLTGKMRLPGFSGEWIEKPISEVCTIVNGGTPSTGVSEYWDGDILWCTPTDITSCKSKYLSLTASTITEKGLQSSSATLLPAGSLLLCSRATIGEVRIAQSKIATNQGFKSLIVNDSINNEWLYYLVCTLKPKMIEKAIGSTFLEISKSDLSSIVIHVPPFEEQIAIATILFEMDAEIERLEKKLAKYRQIKQGMMQELLTGRIRLLES